MPKDKDLNRNFFRRPFPYDEVEVDEVSGTPKGVLANSPAVAEAARLLGKPSEVVTDAMLTAPGLPKEGWQEISKAVGLPVSTPEEEAANRELFKDSPITGDTQAAIADFIQKPSFTNFFGMPLAAVSMTGKPAEKGLEAIGAPGWLQTAGSIFGDPLMVGPSAISKAPKLKNMATISPQALKLFEAAKMGSVEARAAIAADPALQAMQNASEVAKTDAVGGAIRNKVKASKIDKGPDLTQTGSSLKNRFKDTKGTTPVGESLRNRFEARPEPMANLEAKLPGETGALRTKYGVKDKTEDVAKVIEGDNVITGQSPAPSPSPAPAPQAPASPVITATQPAPAPSPVPTTPTAAEETVGLAANKPWWDRSVKVPLTGLDVSVNPIQNIRNNPKAAVLGTAATAGGLAYGMGRDKQLKADQSMIDAAAQNAQVKPPVGGVPGVPDPAQGEPPPPTGAAALTKQPSEQDIYDDELKQLQVGGIENLNDAANSIASAREASVDPQVAAAQQGVQNAIGDVNKQAEEKVPEREWNEKLGLILASIGGGLSGDTQAPVRLSEVMRQGQRQRISDMQTGAEQKLRASQTGLDATLAGSRERLQRGEQKVGDVGRIAELRNAATKLAIEAQTSTDPRRRAQAEAQLALINSEIAKNRSSANYYESGAKVNKTLAETDKIRLENDRIKMINEIIEKNKKSPNRPSASK